MGAFMPFDTANPYSGLYSMDEGWGGAVGGFGTPDAEDNQEFGGAPAGGVIGGGVDALPLDTSYGAQLAGSLGLGPTDGVTTLPLDTFDNAVLMAYLDNELPGAGYQATLSYNAAPADPWGDWSGLGDLAKGYAAVEAYGDRFIVGGGMIVAGGGVFYAGETATAAAVVAAPETSGLSLAVLPFTVPVAAAGAAMFIEGFDYLINEDFTLLKKATGAGGQGPP